MSIGRDQTVPRHHGQLWGPADDGTLTELFHQGAGLGDMGFLLGRTELAIRYRLMNLGLREDWELREYDKKRGMPALPPIDPDPAGSSHAHEHMHFDIAGYGSPFLKHYHYHDTAHHIKHRSKDEVFAIMYGAGPQTIDKMRPVDHPTKHHVHIHNHPRVPLYPSDDTLAEQNHSHDHVCGHHIGERNAHGAVVTGSYTGPMLKFRPVSSARTYREALTEAIDDLTRRKDLRRRAQERRDFLTAYQGEPRPRSSSWGEHHTHRHEHQLGNKIHIHEHFNAHHRGERDIDGVVVTSRYKGPLMQYKTLPPDLGSTGTITGRLSVMPGARGREQRRRTIESADMFRAIGDSPGVRAEKRHWTGVRTMDFSQIEERALRDYSMSSRSAGQLNAFEAVPKPKMRRYSVYYTDNFSPRTEANGPTLVVARRGYSPDQVIETALRRLDRLVIDVEGIDLFLVDVGEDKGYGQMIDVKLSAITVTGRKWELTAFTTL